MYKTFRFNGTERIDILTSINNSQFVPASKFAITSLTAEVFKTMPQVSTQSNMSFTPQQVLKYSNTYCAVNVTVDDKDVIRVTPNQQLLIKMLVKASGVTHYKNLLKGMVSNFDSLTGVSLPAEKAGKRLGLMNGLSVIGSIPIPDIRTGALPDGICLVSKAYADKFELLDRNGNIVPLSNGDKLAGSISGYLIKGTARVVDMDGCDMVLSDDTIKASNTSCGDNLHVQLLCRERLTYNANMTYETWCWMPDLLKKRIKKDLASPYEYRVLLHRYDTENYQAFKTGSFGPEEYSHTIETVPTLNAFLLGLAPRAAYASLFTWFDDDGFLCCSPVYDAIIKNGVKPNIGKISDRIKLIVRDLISHSVTGAWSVANLLTDDTPNYSDDVISIPYHVYKRLGEPASVAVCRSPFVLLLKMTVRTHDDGDDFRVTPSIMKLFGGDMDGDLIQIVADVDVVQVCKPPSVVMKDHLAFIDHVSAAFDWIKTNHKEYHMETYKNHCKAYGIPEHIGFDARFYQHFVAFALQMVPQASTILSNMISFDISNSDFVKLFRVIKQASLDQQNGGFPMFNLLMDNFFSRSGKKSYISRLTGLDDKFLAKFIKYSDPYVVFRYPLTQMVARGFDPVLDKELFVKYQKLNNPFSKILRAFAGMYNVPADPNEEDSDLSLEGEQEVPQEGTQEVQQECTQEDTQLEMDLTVRS